MLLYIYVFVLLLKLMYFPHALFTSHALFPSTLSVSVTSTPYTLCACCCMFIYCRPLFYMYAIFIRIRVTGRCCSGSYSTVSHIGELIKNVTIFKQAHRDIFLWISRNHFCFKSVAHPKMTNLLLSTFLNMRVSKQSAAVMAFFVGQPTSKHRP